MKPWITIHVLLTLLVSQCWGSHPDGLTRPKRQLLGGEACMHIYSVPKTLTRCEPTQETINQLDELRGSLGENHNYIDELKARIDELDPNEHKQLPEDVQRRLATVDEVEVTQARHGEFLDRLESELGHVTDRLRNVESSDKTEMTRLVELQTHLIELTLRQTNVTLHEDYMDQLTGKTGELLQRLQQLELDFQDRVHMAEASLDEDLRRTEDLGRESLQQLRERVNDALLRLEEKLKKEVGDRLGQHNQTLAMAKLVDKMENQLTLLRERQAQYDVRETELREEIATLQARLAAEAEEKSSLLEESNNFRLSFQQLVTEVGEYDNRTDDLRDEMKHLAKLINRKEHLSPRTLKVVDCQDALKYYHPASGVYDINPFPHTNPFEVYCEMYEMADEGWTVIQRRQDGSENFFRGWQDYKEGFGDVEGEHWLGLQKIHGLTNRRKYRLRVEMEDWDGSWWRSEYDHFFIDDESENYKLHVAGYHGNAGDALGYHNNMAFSTMDRNNDDNDGICATWCHGAWWYKSCFQSNLNGRYYAKGPYVTNTSWGDGVVWRHIQGTNYYSLKSVVMKIKAHDHRH